MTCPRHDFSHTGLRYGKVYVDHRTSHKISWFCAPLRGYGTADLYLSFWSLLCQPL